MRLLFTFLLLVTFSVTHSQQPDSNTIVPGVGVGDLQLGISKEQVLNLIGTSYDARDYVEEREIYNGSRYPTDDMIQFIIGFDEVFVYNTPQKYPVFKLYFKNDELVYIILTTYTTGQEMWNNLTLENSGFRYLDEMNTVLDYYGPEDVFMDDINYDGFFIYWSRGIEFCFDEKELRVIYIFEPLLI